MAFSNTQNRNVILESFGNSSISELKLELLNNHHRLLKVNSLHTTKILRELMFLEDVLNGLLKDKIDKRNNLLSFLNDTLIPDLEDSENEGMVNTLRECISFME